MRRSLVTALLALLAMAITAQVDAEPSQTSPTPRMVADKMSTCMQATFSIIGPTDPSEAGAVVVTTSEGAFAIKEFNVLRMSRLAAIMISQKPNYSLLYVTFPEQVGNGYIDTTPTNDFQRRVVDCFYGMYIGMDVAS